MCRDLDARLADVCSLARMSGLPLATVLATLVSPPCRCSRSSFSRLCWWPGSVLLIGVIPVFADEVYSLNELVEAAYATAGESCVKHFPPEWKLATTSRCMRIGTSQAGHDYLRLSLPTSLLGPVLEARLSRRCRVKTFKRFLNGP